MFRVTPEAAVSATSFGARTKHAQPQPAPKDGFSALVESNASAAQDTDRAAHSAPDAPPKRLNGRDSQTKTDNRPDSKTDNPTDGKAKSQASLAANSNGETAVDTDDASQPTAADETGISGDAVTIVLSSANLAAAAEPKAATDEITETADTASVATSAIPAIVDSAASVVAVAIPVVSAAPNAIAAPAPEDDATIATIQSTVVATAATTSSLPAAAESAVAIPVPTGAIPTTLTTGTPDAPSVATTPTNAAVNDDTAEAATPNAASSQIVTGETGSIDSELAANAALSAQAAAAVPAPDKPKSTSTTPPAPTQVLTSADAEAASALNPAPSLPSQTADAAAPRGAESIGGAADKSGSPADKAEAFTPDPKQSNTPLAAAPAEHRAPTAATHSASLDLGVQAPQTPPPQSFQAQIPNIIVTPAAQLNATLANTPVPINGLAVDIALRAAGGASRFEIRLDPAELGRIDVRLDVDKHGNVTSHLTVEKPSTLDMLRRDAPQLQRALEDAGLKTGDSGLQFSLRDQSSSGRNDDNNSGRNSQRLIISEDDTVPAQVAGKTYGRMLGSSGGVDIRV